MKADPDAQLQLLEVQADDARADQLRHQLRTLPEAAELAEVETTRAALDDGVRDARILVDDLSLEQRKADADVEQVKSRRTRDRQRIDQGLITNPKDLERMQSEMVSLERRITTLEDEELEVMERLEQAQAELDRLVGELAAAEERRTELAAARDRKAAELEQDLAAVLDQRASHADGLPEELVALYQKLRESKGGVGAAALRARRCEGCMLTLDHAELAEIKQAPGDQVIRCEECQRILVRTGESGL